MQTTHLLNRQRLAFSVDNMTTTRTTEHRDAGAKIRARRAFLRLSRPTIAKATGGVLYVELQKRIEDGDKKVRTLLLHQIAAYLTVLEWTGEDFERETGVELPDGQPTVPGSEPYEGSLIVGYYGTVAAGLQSVEQEDEAERLIPIDPTLPGLRGRTKGHLGLLRVNGDSMVSPKAAESIPEGSMVLVEWGAAPAPNDVVVAWLEDRQTAVLKQYQEGTEAVLRSFNPSGPVFRADEAPIVRGVVRTVMRKP